MIFDHLTNVRFSNQKNYMLNIPRFSFLIVCFALLSSFSLTGQPRVMTSDELPQLLETNLLFINNCARCARHERTKNKRGIKVNKCKSIPKDVDFSLTKSKRKDWAAFGEVDTLDVNTKTLLFSLQIPGVELENLRPQIELFNVRKEVIFSNAGKPFSAFCYEEKDTPSKIENNIFELNVSEKETVAFVTQINIPENIYQGEGIIKITYLYNENGREKAFQTVFSKVYLK